MSKRLMATAAAIALLSGLAGCAQDEPETASTAVTEASTAPTTAASADPGTALVGTWRADAADWTVHFNEDGTFTEDFEGNVDFRRGTYRVEDDTVHLEGDDGESSEGELSGDTINFRLGMLERL